MDPLKVAARFVAFTCFLNLEDGEPVSADEASRLARDHWKKFVPLSRRQLGEFLTREPDLNERRIRVRKRAKRELALAT